MTEHRPKVLYVDDEPINLKLFEINFRKKFDVITANSGPEGLRILENNSVDVVISDMKMPEMNGVTFCETAQKKYNHIRYYLLTGFDSTPEIEEAISRSIVKKCLRKPFNKYEIEEVIQN